MAAKLQHYRSERDSFAHREGLLAPQHAESQHLLTKAAMEAAASCRGSKVAGASTGSADDPQSVSRLSSEASTTDASTRQLSKSGAADVSETSATSSQSLGSDPGFVSEADPGMEDLGKGCSTSLLEERLFSFEADPDSEEGFAKDYTFGPPLSEQGDARNAQTERRIPTFGEWKRIKSSEAQQPAATTTQLQMIGTCPGGLRGEAEAADARQEASSPGLEVPWRRTSLQQKGGFVEATDQDADAGKLIWEKIARDLEAKVATLRTDTELTKLACAKFRAGFQQRRLQHQEENALLASSADVTGSP
eukprot:TRINITY_DN12639_c0_g1_i2.p1 TRINITY_DN12639_c0_g1~~TRINITY_DN12639_c0_g1_i2.p1  ORF type:complete len:306 (-),score=72.86 TRINITY_DN12639_c0_g1_i2:502-1419(-)